MCWHSWGTFPDPFDVRAGGDLDEQATQEGQVQNREPCGGHDGAAGSP